MEDLVVNGLDVKPINYIAEKVDIVTIVFYIVIDIVNIVFDIVIDIAISYLTRLPGLGSTVSGSSLPLTPSSLTLLSRYRHNLP